MPGDPRSLRRSLSMWSAAATLVALLVFAGVAYVIVTLEEREEADGGAPDDPETEILVALAIAAPLGIGLSVLASRLAARRAMAAIDRAAQTAAEISIDRFDRRMEMPAEDHELRPLANAINSLLDRLQRGYEALGAFSASASHELRTPIAAVCSELEVHLRRPRTAAEWETTATTVLGELRRLGDVVQAMLRFAQADAIREADATEIDLAELVEEVAAQYAEVATRTGVTLTATLAIDHAIVRGDASLLATAISNLTTNALRAAAPNGRVTIGLASEAGKYAIQVDDTGPGLPADHGELFVPFARVDPTRPRQGIGLGLAIAQRIAARHGGSIAHAPRPGGGMRFTIALAR